MKLFNIFHRIEESRDQEGQEFVRIDEFLTSGDGISNLIFNTDSLKMPYFTCPSFLHPPAKNV